MTEVSHKRRPRRHTAKKGAAAPRILVPCAPHDLESFERIDWTLRTILKEVKQNRGKYPHSARAPTIREVLVRGGLSKTYLEFQGGNLYRENLKERYKKKIKRVLGRIATARYRSQSPAQSAAETARADTSAWSKLRDQLQALKQRWVEAELEYIDAESRVRKLEESVQELTGENERLRSLLTESNIRVLHRT